MQNELEELYNMLVSQTDIMKNVDELVEKLKAIGFEIDFVDENNNYAIYKDQNPIVIRVIARK